MLIIVRIVILAQRDLVPKGADEIALGEELAAKHVVDIQTPSSVNQVDARDKYGIKDTKDRSQIQSVTIVGRNIKLRVDDVSGIESVYVATMYHIRGQSKPKAFEVTVELCGEPHKLEIDTGATRTVLNEET